MEEVGSKAAMPINMLRVLFKKLTTDKNVPSTVKQGSEYFLYFIDQKDGAKMDSQKMNFLTYYLTVADGLVNWPLEVTMALRSLAEEHAMYKLARGVNTEIIRTQLGSEQKDDGVIRKNVRCEDLLKYVAHVNKTAPTPGSGPQSLSGSHKKIVSTRELALEPFSAWTEKHWDSALRILRFSTPAKVMEMEGVIEETLRLNEKQHSELAKLLQPKETVILMSDEEKDAYELSILEADFSKNIAHFRTEMLRSDYDIDDLLKIALSSPEKYDRSWGRVIWRRALFFFSIILAKEKQEGIYNISAYGQGSSSNIKQQEVVTKNLQIVEKSWLQSQEQKTSLGLSEAQVTLARYLFDQNEAVTNFFPFRSAEERCLRENYQKIYESITGHSDMS